MLYNHLFPFGLQSLNMGCSPDLDKPHVFCDGSYSHPWVLRLHEGSQRPCPPQTSEANRSQRDMKHQ